MKGKLTVDFLPESGKIEYAVVSKGNNIAPKDASAIIKKHLQDTEIHKRKHFIIGEALHEKFHFWDYKKYDGYFGCVFSDAEPNESGGYAFPENKIPRVILNAINDKPFRSIVILFDDNYEEYATKIRFTYGGNSYIMENHRLFTVYSIEGQTSRITIDFLEWSRAKSVVKIRRVNTSYCRSYDAEKIISFTASAESRPDPNKIEYGLSSQYGSVELLDTDCEFEILNEYEMLQDNQPIKISFEKQDGETVNEKTIGIFLSQDWEISPNDNTIKVNLTDALTRLNDVSIDELALKELNCRINYNYPVNAKQIIGYLLGMSGLTTGSEYTVEYCRETEQIITNDLYLEKGSISECLKKILNYCKCRLYIRNDKIIIVKS